MDFREKILGNLKKRNESVKQHYSQIFSSYSDLIERFVALKAQNDRLLRKDSTTESDGHPQGAGDGKQLAELRQELNDLYKKKAQNDQQLIDTNNKLQSKERELAKAKKDLEDAWQTIGELKVKNSDLEEKMAEMSKTNEHLKDEYLALQATFNGVDEKYRQLKRENQQLIDRWKDLKAKEVEMMNQQNEEVIKLRQQRMQNDLKEAAKQQVPVFDERKYGEGHDSEVNAIQWSPSGRFFVTGGADRKIKMWQIKDGKQRLHSTFTGCNQAVMSLEFDSEEVQLLASSNDYASRIWTLSDQRNRHSLTGHSAKVLAAKFHSGSAHVVSGSHDRTIKLWDLRTGVRWMSSKKLRFWDTRNDSPIYDILLTGKITSLDLSLDGQCLLCCTRDDSLVAVDLRTNRTIHTYSGESFKIGFDYSRAVFSPDMEYCVAGAADGSVFIWNVKSTKIEKILTKGHE